LFRITLDNFEDSGISVKVPLRALGHFPSLESGPKIVSTKKTKIKKPKKVFGRLWKHQKSLGNTFDKKNSKAEEEK